MNEQHKNIVKYHNDLNEITFQKFNQVDFDFFMVLCSKLRDSQNNEVTISFDDFKQLAGYSPKTSEQRFVNEVDSMNLKQLLSTGRIVEGDKIKRFTLFTDFEIDQSRRTITAKVNVSYRYILNEVTKNFTRFELQEFISLDSKYAKNLYRLLKQFRTTGLYKVDYQDFKRLMSIPKSYSNRDINAKIIKPCIATLGKSFDKLHCKVLYEPKRGRPVRGYEFTFVPESVPRIRSTETENLKEKSNSFHNFDQRDYDFSELEKKLRR